MERVASAESPQERRFLNGWALRGGSSLREFDSLSSAVKMRFFVLVWGVEKCLPLLDLQPLQIAHGAPGSSDFQAKKR